MKLSEENIKKLNEIKTHYPNNRAVIMPCLWLIQDQYGWISEDGIKHTAELLEVPYEYVYGVAHFYTMYNKKPIGKYHLQLCTNVSCMLCGSYDLFNYISEKLQIKNGKTTQDKLFTLTEVECLGSCGTAPTLQVNDYYEENITKERIDKLIEDIKTQK
jgi:NADH-quinone oxidoreductase subunit E